uniref:Uncharacterized protein n=1 Tax=Anguilla anguilla TaxID=7936 RepID=A0A0E9RD06_ANGAN
MLLVLRVLKVLVNQAHGALEVTHRHAGCMLITVRTDNPVTWLTQLWHGE